MGIINTLLKIFLFKEMTEIDDEEPDIVCKSMFLFISYF